MVYLPKAVVPVSLVLDLHIGHDRFGSNSDPSLNGHLLTILLLVRLGGYTVTVDYSTSFGRCSQFFFVILNLLEEVRRELSDFKTLFVMNRKSER